MHKLDEKAIEFNGAVLAGLKRAISLYYRKSKKLYMTENQAVELFKAEINKTALTELCPQMFNLTTEMYSDAVKYDWNIEHTRDLEILRNNNVFQVSKYYDKLESIGMVDEISKSFQSGGRNVDNILKELKTNIEPIRKTAISYNKMLVNTVGQNARNISQAKDLFTAGFKYSKIVGFRDELTCPICKKMIGRVFKVSEQIKVVDQYLSVDYQKLGYEDAIDKIKDIKPWITLEDAENLPAVDYENDKENYKDSKILVKKFSPGLLLPSFHASCRCETKAVENIN